MKAAVPEGSRFKGYEPFLVQDLVISATATCYRRERWVTPDGRSVLAPLPEGVDGHFGPDLRRFVLVQYNQGQSTLPRIASFLRSAGAAVSERQLQRLLTDQQESFVAEASGVLRASPETAPCVCVDDTGARHKGKNGHCAQAGNDWFARFGTRASKSRLNFLELLRAGHADYVLNEAARGHMRKHSLSAPLVAELAAQPQASFPDRKAWLAHLEKLGSTKLGVTPDPVRVATEAALRGSVRSHKFLCGGTVLSDGAGRFNVGTHALCRVHAERPVHKLDTFADAHRAARAQARGLIWDFYPELKDYRAKPDADREAAPRERFDRTFLRSTGLVTPDRLQKRLHANKPGLLTALDRPETPLHTNRSERGIRCCVTRRKVGAGTRGDVGRDCRDAFLGLAETCAKLGIEVRDCLGSRLKVAGTVVVPPLDVLRQGAAPVCVT